MKRPNFLDLCNLWLKRKCDDMMGDITDGNIWMSSMSPGSKPINILGLLMNVDWFKIFPTLLV